MSVGVLDGGHPVEEAQRTEPGVPAEEQPHGHDIIAVPVAWIVDASFGVSSRVALDVKLPVHATFIDAGFTDSANQTIEGFESIHHRDETVAGVGDLRLGVQLGALLGTEVPGLRMTIRAGLSLPTGKVEDDPFALGESGLRHQHTFFGAGIVMPELRVDLGYGWTHVSLSSWFETRLSLYEGPKQYRPSTTYSGGVAVGTGFGLERWTFTLAHEVFHEQAARWNDVPAENSGRTELLLAAGAQWRVAEAWTLSFTAKTPYVTWSHGDQFSFPFLGVLGVRWSTNVL